MSTPAEARALRRPIVYVQGNIHAGEVEGKEALLALLRDLTNSPEPNVLDSIILIAVPIYNADGNEKFASQEVNRREQNGPELVGERANAQGFDLNRDYVKAEAPETRASLAMFNAWDPGRVRGPSHDRRQLSWIRADLRAATQSSGTAQSLYP